MNKKNILLVEDLLRRILLTFKSEQILHELSLIFFNFDNKIVAGSVIAITKDILLILITFIKCLIIFLSL